MNTKFDVTLTRTDGLTYGIDLGIDVLAGFDDDKIRELAERSEKIRIQSPCRTLKTITNGITLAEHLQKEFPNVTVTEGTIKEDSDATKVKKLVKKYDSIEAVMAKLAEIDDANKTDETDEAE